MFRSNSAVGRRTVLKGALGVAPMMLGASAASGEIQASYPPDVNRKFYADGRVYPFPGNTIICHVPQQGQQSYTFDALLDIYRDAPNHGFTRKIALLPPSSYHMTVLGGANDRPRNVNSWPANLPLDLPLARCTATLRDRLAQAGIGCDLPIRMKVDPVQNPINGQALIMLLLPADSAEETKLRVLRQKIAAATSLPLPQPDSYRFHISIGYSIAWLTSNEFGEMRRVFNGWAEQMAGKAPIIELGAPEFCSFKDMYAFHRLLLLSGNADA